MVGSFVKERTVKQHMGLPVEDYGLSMTGDFKKNAFRQMSVCQTGPSSSL